MSGTAESKLFHLEYYLRVAVAAGDLTLMQSGEVFMEVAQGLSEEAAGWPRQLAVQDAEWERVFGG